MICILAGSVGTAGAADVPTTYTVNDTALKAAVAGTNLTFTLYTDAACSQQALQQVVPIESVDFVSRLKRFTPKSAPKGPNIDEVHETLRGVNAAGSLYLTVTGTGITPVGFPCQAQATVQPPAPVVKDANGTILGISSGYLTDLGWIAYRNVGGQTVGIPYTASSFGGVLLYPIIDCHGQPYVALGVTGDVPYANGVVVGTRLFYANGPPTMFTAKSYFAPSSSPGCSTGPYTDTAMPAATAYVPAFFPPFHVEVP